MDDLYQPEITDLEKNELQRLREKYKLDLPPTDTVKNVLRWFKHHNWVTGSLLDKQSIILAEGAINDIQNTYTTNKIIEELERAAEHPDNIIDWDYRQTRISALNHRKDD